MQWPTASVRQGRSGESEARLTCTSRSLKPSTLAALAVNYMQRAQQ